ncbi:MULTISPECIES: zinc ribbon domain-containing protein [unclassified Streptomyces]|uniref:zinc ribbon domain-containing protein n=1 Tax=unclassified Streptomyces TaxID=2593676 RepID=UPI003D8EF04F
MEAGGMGRTLNTRLSQQARGQIADRMRHLATEQGIAVVTVPARNTSKLCPHRLTPLRHRKAPDQPTIAGWKWAICPHQNCRWQGDRDHGAWRRIATRGLTHQAVPGRPRPVGAGPALPACAHPKPSGRCPDDHAPPAAAGGFEGHKEGAGRLPVPAGRARQGPSPARAVRSAGTRDR